MVEQVGGWRLGEHAWSSWLVAVAGGEPVEVRLRGRADHASVAIADGDPVRATASWDGPDLVLTTGRQFMRFYEKTLPLKVFAVPIKFPPMRFYQLWHQRVHQSPEHKWLRDQVSAAARALVQA